MTNKRRRRKERMNKKVLRCHLQHFSGIYMKAVITIKVG
ncbi:unnamed protein product [Trichobilharzia regenti]|nr:unnamed protein product [Trichobilharzia regenti]